MELAEIDSTLIRHLPFSYAKRFSLLPVRKEDGAVIVASSRPDEFQPIDDLRHLLNSPVRPVFMEEKALLDLIHLTPEGDSESYIRSLRLQDLEDLDIQSLKDLALALAKPKLMRAAEQLELLVQEASAAEEGG